MPNDWKRPPTRSEAGMAGAREREVRLSGALRDNLLKRKMQQRARAEEPERREGAEPSSTPQPEKAPVPKS